MKNLLFLFLLVGFIACDDDEGLFNLDQFTIERVDCDKEAPNRYVLRADGLYKFVSYENVMGWCGTCLMMMEEDERNELMETDFQNSHKKINSNAKEDAFRAVYDALPAFLEGDSGAAYGCSDAGQECRYRITNHQEPNYEYWDLCVGNEELLTAEQLAWKEELDALFELLN